MLHLIPRINKNVIYRNQDDNTWVLFNPESSSIHLLKTLGWHLWNALDDNFTVKEIIERLKETYKFEVQQERLEEIVPTFLKNLEERGLIFLEKKSC